MKTVLFTGGGSAGHVIPNLALMNEIRYSHRVIYMGASGLERTLVFKAGYPFFEVDCPKLIRSFTLKNLTIPFRLKRAVRAAEGVLKEQKPDLVFSKGGFVSYPAVAAAHKLHIPVLTHESDLSPGLCTKLIKRKCEKVLTSFPETAERFSNGVFTGSPIRKEILNGERARARKKFSLPDEKPVLLVLGGGSGSRAINETLRSQLSAILKTFCVLHLTGKGNCMNNPPAGYIQREFESDMGSCYAACDVVLSRAGSNTVFEIMALKKPAVLVPLQKSSRGDQVENALYFQKKGACRLLYERDLAMLRDAITAAYSDEKIKKSLETLCVSSGTQKILSVIEQFST